MKKQNRTFIFLHCFYRVSITHTKSAKHPAKQIYTEQKQLYPAQMEPVSCDILKLTLHRAKSTICNQAFHFFRQFMS